MEKLLQIAKESAEQAEVFFTRCKDNYILIEDSNFKTVESSFVNGVALRIIKNGKIGFAYTRNLLDPKKLVEQALDSAEAGAKALFDFPKTDKIADLKTYDAGIEQIDKNKLVNDAKGIISYIKAKIDCQINIHYSFGVTEKGIINSSGTNLKEKKSSFSIHLIILFPGTKISIMECVLAKKYQTMDIVKIDKLIALYKLNEQQIIPQTGKMKVILMSQALMALMNCFNTANHPFYFCNKTTPLLNKLNQQIFSDQLTIYQDPLNDDNFEATAFDDEGVDCQKLVFVEKGVLKQHHTTLNYAAKLNCQSTGNAVRNGIESLPLVKVECYRIEPGNKSLEEMIAGIDEGLIVYSVMGAGNGNVLAGDYSLGVMTGFYIKNGKIIGRVKDCMIAGNIYETFNQIDAIENETHYCSNGNFPAIAFNGISVAGVDAEE